MAQAQKDDNNISTIQGLLNTDGATPTNLEADPTSHILDADDGTTGSDNGGSRALRDDNHTPVAIAVSELDGTTPVALYVDANGNLLIDSN